MTIDMINSLNYTMIGPSHQEQHRQSPKQQSNTLQLTSFIAPRHQKRQKPRPRYTNTKNAVVNTNTLRQNPKTSASKTPFRPSNTTHLLRNTHHPSPSKPAFEHQELRHRKKPDKRNHHQSHYTNTSHIKATTQTRDKKGTQKSRTPQQTIEEEET